MLYSKLLLTTSQQQFSMVLTLYIKKMLKIQVEPQATGESLVSLPSFEHFMVSFYGLQEYRP